MSRCVASCTAYLEEISSEEDCIRGLGDSSGHFIPLPSLTYFDVEILLGDSFALVLELLMQKLNLRLPYKRLKLLTKTRGHILLSSYACTLCFILFTLIKIAGIPWLTPQELAFSELFSLCIQVLLLIFVQIIRHGLWYKQIAHGRAYGNGLPAFISESNFYCLNALATRCISC